jgi:hypothetical protein
VAQIETACAQPELTVNLYIDMRSPSAPLAYEAFLRAGCVYTGFMPLSAGHEYIIMHKPGAAPMRYAAMKLTPHTAETLTQLGVALCGEKPAVGIGGLA